MRVSSQANASWDNSPTSLGLPTEQGVVVGASKRQNTLPDDKDIQDLLGLLRTTHFVGQIDPKAHSQYLQAPEL